ncbi:MAG: hypothetical protein K2G67_02660 [Muribaculaceae bacterium]|nr:hypothetical protein [Muribaculaceae bacterium]
MKKFYSTLALVCAVGVTAFAATPVAEQKASKLVNEIQTVEAMQVVPGAKQAKAAKAPQKVAASVEEIEGFYDVDYESMFTSGRKDKTTATIEAASEDQILISMEPYCSGYSNMSMDPLIASYDASTGTITLKMEENETLGTFEDSDGTVYTLGLNMYERVPNPNEPGKYMAQPIDEIEAVVQADGSIVFGDDATCFGFALLELPGSYAGGFMGATFVAPDFFKFVASEWDNVGDALFTEDWMNLWLYDDEPQAVLQPRNRTLYRNIADKNVFAVENPFKGWNAWNEDPNADGFIVFSIENPDLVPMRPLTRSGLWLTLTTGGFPQELYIFNQEGFYVYNNGMSIAETLNAFVANDIEASVLDKTTSEVTLKNLCFGYTDKPAGSTYYPTIEGGVYKIKADAFTKGDGVNSVLNDANGPKRFFNLQGVEIANPAAGELVIVKEGNKTSKVIF